MTPKPVEWVLAIYYGSSAHRATYGRLDNTKYTKDYIQLSRKTEFLTTISSLFPVDGQQGLIPLTYQWPKGTAEGTLVFQSADRPHLKWETTVGAPKAWKMSNNPSENTAETIPGDPNHLDFNDAENELAQLISRGAGQPYLLAIKLRDESNKLHLRAYLDNPSDEFSWASIGLMPPEVQELISTTSQESALAWKNFQSGGVPRNTNIENLLLRIGIHENLSTIVEGLEPDLAKSIALYLRNPGYGLFFDPTQNHDAWLPQIPLPIEYVSSIRELLKLIDEKYPAGYQEDSIAESLASDPDEIACFNVQINEENYEVSDSTATTKTRGSAQKVFSDRVKRNYEFRCALTGITTKDFLVASHIVPWCEDQCIRLDPANGICLSLIVDRAFEKGYLIIEDDLYVHLNRDKIGDDKSLLLILEPLDGCKIRTPIDNSPKIEYLQRRRNLVTD